MSSFDALLIGKNEFVLDMASFALTTKFHFKIEVIGEFLGTTDFSDNLKIIVCQADTPKKEFEGLLEYREEVSLDLPLILFGCEQIPEELNEFQESITACIGHDQLIQNLQTQCEKFFNRVSEGEKYACSIPFRVLPKLGGVEEDVYIRLGREKLVKLFQRGDEINDDDVSRYAEKGVHKLYFNIPISEWILNEVDRDFEKNMEAANKGEKIQFDLSTKPDATEMPVITSPDLEDEEFNDSSDKALSDDDENNGTENLQQDETFLQNMEKLEHVFSISEEQKNQLKNFKKKALSNLKNDPILKKYYKRMEKNISDDPYYHNHNDMLSLISVGLANFNSLGNAITYEKLILAANLHDLLLSGWPGLSKIQNLTELAGKIQEFSPEAIKMYQAHPKKTSDLVLKMEECPTEVDSLVLSHHEDAVQKGFPEKISPTRLTPLSALFIIAHDMVNYVMNNPDWAPEEYLNLAMKKYKGGKFDKIRPTLKRMRPFP